VQISVILLFWFAGSISVISLRPSTSWTWCCYV